MQSTVRTMQATLIGPFLGVESAHATRLSRHEYVVVEYCNEYGLDAGSGWCVRHGQYAVRGVL